MPRPDRETARPYHHVMNQGIRKTNLFRDDGDRRRFVALLFDSAARTESAIVAYCLMGNHFHAVVYCPTGELAELCRLVTGRYAQAFNRRHELRGPLFGSRFRSTPIRTDAQLLTTTRYVHRNPLELGLDIEAYPWSSYPAYIERASRTNLDMHVPLDLIGGPDRYRSFVQEPMPADAFSFSDGRLAWSPQPAGYGPIENVVSAVAASARESASLRSRRTATLLIVVESNTAPASEIAKELGYRSGAVVRTLASRARVRLATDPEFADLVSRATRALQAAA